MCPNETLEERVDRLEATMAELASRLAALGPTGAVALSGSPPVAALPEADESDEPGPPADDGPAGAILGSAPAYAGRTLLVLGGAFLVRSLTESGTFSTGLGVSLGILYALAWLLLADRAAARGEAQSGAFHALASALIVYPLIYEAATRFALLVPWAAAVALAAITAIGLVVAWRRAFHAVAWINVLAALAVGALLLFRMSAVLEFVLFFLALAAASLALAYGRGWRGQRWVVALALDALVLLLGALRWSERPPDWLAPGPVIVAGLGLTVVYLGALVLRLLYQGRELTAFAVTQTVLVCLVGFEMALAVASEDGKRAIAVAAVVCAALLHAVLARGSERRWGHGAAVGYFSSLATFLAAEGVRGLLPATVYPLVWGAAAVVLAVLALGGERPILQVHTGILSLAAAISSGLLGAAFAALAFGAASVWPELTPTALAVLALALASAVLLERGTPRAGGWRAAAAARNGARFVALLGLGGLVARAVAGAFAGAPGAEADAGRLAVGRTAVLVVAALALAGWHAAGGRRELGFWSVALLVAGGLKLAAEDLRLGSASTLVFSLVLYGVALIAVPALARRARTVALPLTAAGEVRYNSGATQTDSSRRGGAE